jgi:hypothetical protein
VVEVRVLLLTGDRGSVTVQCELVGKFLTATQVMIGERLQITFTYYSSFKRVTVFKVSFVTMFNGGNSMQSMVM